jgi:hypothetical protein
MIGRLVPCSVLFFIRVIAEGEIVKTAPAMGQFGRDYFDVISKKGSTHPAKYLRDVTGTSYIINPKTEKPYIVPHDYEPSATAAHFSKLYNQRVLEVAPAGQLPTVYPELYDAFKRGGWGDLQRPLADKTDVFVPFRDAASFNLGVGAAAGGATALEAKFFGGMYNVWEETLDKLFGNPWEYGNNPGNPSHIDIGSSLFNQGSLGIRFSPEY